MRLHCMRMLRWQKSSVGEREKMKNYVKPIVLANEELAEGVYAASGAGMQCYNASARITQTPELGRENYCVHTDAEHAAADMHHSSKQILTLYFNQPVNYVSCNDSSAQCTGGNGTANLQITYHYHNNAYENIGLGDVYVESAAGLDVTGAKLECDYGVGDSDHSW